MITSFKAGSRRSCESAWSPYQAQRPFEHEVRLKELLARQAHLNSALDPDKSDARGATSPHPVSYARSAAKLPASPLTPGRRSGDRN